MRIELPVALEQTISVALLLLQATCVALFVERLRRCYTTISLMGLIAVADNLLLVALGGFTGLPVSQFFSVAEQCTLRRVVTQVLVTLGWMHSGFIGLHLIYKSRILNPLGGSASRRLQVLYGMVVVSGVLSAVLWQLTFVEMRVGERCVSYEGAEWGYPTLGAFVITADLCGSMSFCIPIFKLSRVMKRQRHQSSILSAKDTAFTDSYSTMMRLMRKIATWTLVSTISSLVLFPIMSLQVLYSNHILYMMDSTVRSFCVTMASPLPQEGVDRSLMSPLELRGKLEGYGFL